MKKIRQTFSKKYTPLPRGFWKNPLHLIACGFGIGAIPYFPGTFATLLAIPVVLLLSTFSTFTYGIVCTLLFFLGIFLTGKTNRDFKTDDHPAVVFDEIATYPIAMLGISPNWQMILISFLFFRFFDIVKPWPISWMDKNIHGGIGVMLDDLVAAIATLVIMHALHYVI